MKLGLCVPETGPIGKDLQREIADHGFDAIRIDAHPGENGVLSPFAHAQQREQIRCFRDTRFFVVFLVGPGHIVMTAEQLVQNAADFAQKLKEEGYEERGNYALEIGNEPDLALDLWKKHPDVMWSTFVRAYGAVRERLPGAMVLSPSISNLNGRGFDYLSKMIGHLPKDCGIAFHRYPAGKDFDDAHDGFASREAEMQKLKSLVAGRPLYDTETGWAELDPHYELNEDEVAFRIGKEVDFGRSMGLEALFLYQLNSGVVKDGDSKDAKKEKTFGARRADATWSWKPWSDVVKGRTA